MGVPPGERMEESQEVGYREIRETPEKAPELGAPEPRLEPEAGADAGTSQAEMGAPEPRPEPRAPRSEEEVKESLARQDERVKEGQQKKMPQEFKDGETQEMEDQEPELEE